MTETTTGRQIIVTFPQDLTWVPLPRSFPYVHWADSESWAAEAAPLVMWHANPADAAPDPERAQRIAELLVVAQQNLVAPDAHHTLLLFHDIAQAPIPITHTTWIESEPWDEAKRSYEGYAEGGPAIRSLSDPDLFTDVAEEGFRTVLLGTLDPEKETVAARVIYAWRRDGLDCQMTATVLDLSALRDVVPILDDFARRTVATGA